MKLTLSALVKILIEEFIPDIHHKYLLQNYKAFSTYRCYNDIVPPYLRECPRSVILHCLERKSNSRKFNVEDIYIQDQQSGVFTIKGSSGLRHSLCCGFWKVFWRAILFMLGLEQVEYPVQALFRCIQAYSKLELELLTF